MPVTLVFWDFIVAGFLHRIKKQFIHCRLRDDDTFLSTYLCNFSFLVLSWFKIKLLLKTKNCRKQISYSRYFAYPFEIFTQEKTRFSKKIFPVFGWFLPFFTKTIGHKQKNFRKLLTNLLACMIFPGGKSPNLLFLLLGKYRCVCGPFFN